MAPPTSPAPGYPPPAPEPPPAPVPPPAPGGPSAVEQQVIDATNAERRADGCTNDLVADPVLMATAGAHSDDMAADEYFSHTNQEGLTPDARMRQAGFEGSGTGENIAAGQRTVEEVMRGWMASPGHRANILRCSWDVIGVGVTPDGDGTVWTQNFGDVR